MPCRAMACRLEKTAGSRGRSYCAASQGQHGLRVWQPLLIHPTPPHASPPGGRLVGAGPTTPHARSGSSRSSSAAALAGVRVVACGRAVARSCVMAPPANHIHKCVRAAFCRINQIKSGFAVISCPPPPTHLTWSSTYRKPMLVPTTTSNRPSASRSTSTGLLYA